MGIEAEGECNGSKKRREGKLDQNEFIMQFREINIGAIKMPA